MGDRRITPRSLLARRGASTFDLLRWSFPTSTKDLLMRSVIGAICVPALLAAQQSTPFAVGSASAAPGTTAYGVLAIPAGSDSALSMPVAVIRGVRPGPTVAFVAGSHGTEYTSIIAMQRLIPRIDAKNARRNRDRRAAAQRRVVSPNDAARQSGRSQGHERRVSRRPERHADAACARSRHREDRRAGGRRRRSARRRSR